MVPRIALQAFKELKKTMTITKICRLLNVPRSTYYRWREQYTNAMRCVDLKQSRDVCKKDAMFKIKSRRL
ncbi:helix-turn-helix domain-containing protein [Paenisporosarcina sp. OV554]|uniref:helix-turn-helix domain-containing protein n=1 Tax=Paenisporosarcina sp. OV554 TaxID=2135694 RepID=UPI000D389150|nr:Homeodomain-like domain-containing protein [Paenisporosarcina sp. OV554]